MRVILRVFFDLIVIVFSCIAIWGYIRNIKVSKELKKQDGSEIVRKETPKETLDELKVSTRLIFIGVITAMVFKIIVIVIK